MVDKIQENSKVLEHDRIILNNLEQANETGALTDKEIKIQSEIKRIESILPTQVKIPEIFLEILYIAESTGIQQKSFTMQSTIIENGINTSTKQVVDEGNPEENKNIQQSSEQLLILPINHIFKGTYGEIKNYIDEIQKCERKIDVVEYQISKDKEAESLSATFLLHSYALVRDGQNYSEFVDYDFIKGKYGRNNPYIQGAFTEIDEDEEAQDEVEFEDTEEDMLDE
jgi:Tfp pilus assembly protein PilO